MRPPLDGALIVSQLFGGNPSSEAYVDAQGRQVIGHDGIDFACQIGDPIYPAWPGVMHIVDSGDQGFGLHILLLEPVHGRWAIYGHLSKALLPTASPVPIHVPMALAGSSGNSTGPHVHFGVYHSDADNGYGGAVDPLTDFDRDVWPRLDLSRTNL